MDYTRQEDGVLLQMTAEADAEAFSELYDRFSRLVYSIAYRATSDRGLSEEITQDVFLSIWQRAGSYNPQAGKVSSWLAAITRNRAVDLFRRSQTRSEGHARSVDQDPDFDLADGSQEIEGLVEMQQRRQFVIQALAELPSEQRRVLALAYYRGLSHSQIARALDEPLGTVKTRLRLGLQKLGRILQTGSDF